MERKSSAKPRLSERNVRRPYPERPDSQAIELAEGGCCRCSPAGRNPPMRNSCKSLKAGLRSCRAGPVPEIVLRVGARLDVEEQAAFFVKDSGRTGGASHCTQSDRALWRSLRFPRLGRQWPTETQTFVVGRRLATMTLPAFGLLPIQSRDHRDYPRAHDSRHRPPHFQDLRNCSVARHLLEGAFSSLTSKREKFLA